MVYIFIDYYYPYKESKEKKKKKNLSLFLSWCFWSLSKQMLPFFSHDVVLVSILNRNASMFISKKKEMWRLRMQVWIMMVFSFVLIEFTLYTHAHTHTIERRNKIMCRYFLVFYVYICKGNSCLRLFSKLKAK